MKIEAFSRGIGNNGEKSTKHFYKNDEVDNTTTTSIYTEKKSNKRPC